MLKVISEWLGAFSTSLKGRDWECWPCLIRRRRGLRGTLLTAYSYVRRNYKHSSVLARGNGHRLQFGRLRLPLGKRCIFTGMVVQHCNGLTQGSVESASFEDFKIQLDKVTVTRSHVGHNPFPGWMLDQMASEISFNQYCCDSMKWRKPKLKQEAGMDGQLRCKSKHRRPRPCIALFHSLAPGPKETSGTNSGSHWQL